MPESEEGTWEIADGEVRERADREPFRADVEDLTYSNPFGLELERVWSDGRVVYAVELGELEVEFDEERVARNAKVAQEYQVVRAFALDDAGKLKDGREPSASFNIYDSVPGMEQYSPLWQFNYVVVPEDYEANTLRSEADCLESGYPILKSTVVEN